MATSLAEIVKDPNYVNANAATKKAIFDKYSATDPNYANANAATQRAIRVKFGVDMPETPAPSAPAEPPVEDERSGFVQGAINVGAGLLRGAGSIGATIVGGGPAVQGLGLLRNVILPPESREENRLRRQQIDEGLRALTGAQPDSYMYQGGKLAGELAGTAAVPGILANTAAGAGLTTFANALRTGGFGRDLSGGFRNLLLRTGAGATVGGATAGLIDPETATEGAVLGGALPAVAGSSVLRRTATGAKEGIRNFALPFTKGGQQELKASALAKALNNDPTLIQRAIVLFQQGRTPEQVAVELRSTGLADLIKEAPKASYETADIYLQRAQDAAELLKQRASSAEATARAAQREVAEAIDLREAELMREQQLIGMRPPKVSQFETGEAVTKVREDEIVRRQKDIVSPAYERAFAAAQEPFSFQPVVDTAAAIRGTDEVRLGLAGAPDTREILELYRVTPVVRQYPPGSVSGMPLGEPTVTGGAPMVTLRDADKLLRTINKDIYKTKDPDTLRNLNRLKDSVLQSIPENYRKAYSEARDLARTQIIEPFREGWVLNLSRKNVVKDAMLLPEKVTDKVLSGETFALKFASSFHDNPNAKQAMTNGVLGKFRDEVVQDGVIDPGRYQTFMRKYGPQIDALDTVGMNIRSTLDGYAAGARPVSTLRSTAQMEFKQAEAQIDDIVAEASKLRERAMVPATPAESVNNALSVAKDIPGLKKELESIARQLQEGELFENLAAEGSKVGALKFKRIATEAGGETPQLLDRAATIAFNLLRRFRGELDEKLAVQMARELLSADQTTLMLMRAEQLAQKRAPRPKRRVPAGVAAAPGVIGANALAPESQNALAE